jgi:FtsP/CotA-like multicopper oxidase with cupredoxin domain
MRRSKLAAAPRRLAKVWACAAVALLQAGCIQFERDPKIPQLYQPNPVARLGPETPKELIPPGQNEAVISFAAEGVQKYQCRAQGTGFAWVLTGPDARLYNGDNQLVGHHYAGPTWEYQDGSKVTATVMRHVPSENPKSVDQLLLKVEPHAGSGLFASVAYVLRLRTVGGAAPTDPCVNEKVGHAVDIEYSAEYVFYRAN